MNHSEVAYLILTCLCKVRKLLRPDLCLSRVLLQAQNVIKRLEGLERLELLTTLHLRDNQLETLEGISPRMTSLKYLNVR